MRFNCYQCDRVAYLFSDSRCADCTREQPEGLVQEIENDPPVPPQPNHPE